METNFVQELDLFSKSEILEYLGNNDEVFKKLRIEKIINKHKDSRYNFQFVGVIVTDKYVLNVYPKYIPNNNKNIKDDFKQIVKVINKYNMSNRDFDSLNCDLEDISLYMLSLMLFFIEDYYENGIYHNSKKIIETNGNGEINWDKTINSTFPIIKNNVPYYVELQTNYKKDDLFNYFRLLHEFIITYCSRYLEDSKLLEMLDLPPVELSDKIQNDFGDVPYILNRIMRELNVEYNTHKRKLLRLMHSFFSQLDSFTDGDILNVYGVTDYEYVWEDVCSKAFENKLDTKISDLNLGCDCQKPLRKYIKKPVWCIDEVPYKKRRLRPDIISINEDKFFIFDAKYYHFTTDDGKLNNQPDLESITKQYLYELAYSELIGDLNVKNAFLFPVYGKEFIKRGNVKLDIWYGLNLQDIDVIMVPDKIVYDCYLENETINLIEIYENFEKD